MSRQLLRLAWLIGGLALAAGLNAQDRTAAPADRAREVAPPTLAGDTPILQQGRLSDLPPSWIQQLQEMSPEEQESFFSNNERFHNLPLQRKEQIRRRLRAWNNLPMEQRQELVERQQIWEQLPAEQQRQIRESILPRWQSLPLARRQAVLEKFREIRDLDGSRRDVRLNQQSFLEDLSANERQMLRDLSTLGVRDEEE
jgi:hypothetical protein